MKRVLGIAVSITMMASASPIAAGPIVSRPTAAASASGTIMGTATSATGQTLSNFTVQIRNLQNGALAGTTTSSAAGRFSFAGVNPGRYVVEVAGPSGPVVASSPVVDITAGATVAVNIAAAAGMPFDDSAQQSTSGGNSKKKALIITTVAAAAGVAAIIAVAGGDSSPSR